MPLKIFRSPTRDLRRFEKIFHVNQCQTLVRLEYQDHILPTRCQLIKILRIFLFREGWPAPAMGQIRLSRRHLEFFKVMEGWSAPNLGQNRASKQQDSQTNPDEGQTWHSTVLKYFHTENYYVECKINVIMNLRISSTCWKDLLLDNLNA